MKKISILCLIGLLIVGFAIGCKKKHEKNAKAFEPIAQVEFDNAMGKGQLEFSEIFTNAEDASRYSILKEIYENKGLQQQEPVEPPKIPRIIHQIWVGPKTPPSYFVVFQERWKALHPGWEYHLWTDSELEDLNMDLKDLIDQSPNYAEKSDMIRAELLDRFGGVYLDVDMDPFHCLDELHSKFDFYAGIEHPHKIATTNCQIWVGISIIAARPAHPIIQEWKRLIRSRWEEVNRTYSSQIERVINHTYFPFTMAIFSKYQEQGLANIALPTTYFYPLAPNYAAKRISNVRAFREKMYDWLEDLNLKAPRPFSRVAPETLAVHYWGNSWLPSQTEQLKDLQNQLDFVRKECYRMQSKIRTLEQGQLKMESHIATKNVGVIIDLDETQNAA